METKKEDEERMKGGKKAFASKSRTNNLFFFYLTMSGLKSLSANKNFWEKILDFTVNQQNQADSMDSTGASNLQPQIGQATLTSLVHLETLYLRKDLHRKLTSFKFQRRYIVFYLTNYTNTNKPSSPLTLYFQWINSAYFLT